MSIRDLVPRLNRSRELPVRRGEVDTFHSFQREMNRLFDDFLADLPALRWSGLDLGAMPFSPKVDVSENEKEVIVSADLPGMDEKEISVDMDENTLTIRGERKKEQEEGRNWYTREQAYGSFLRTISIPCDTESEKAKACFKKGVLTVKIPKKDSAQVKRKTIQIESD